MNMPPIAEKKPHTMTIHGHTRVDDYYWLREKTNPDVIAYLEAENEYTKALTAHTDDLQAKLYDEMVGRIQETDLSVPAPHGDYFYYSRTEEGQQYPIYCRKKGSLEADEEVVLDVNALAEGQEYLRVGLYNVSPNHNLVAYTLDLDGSEAFTLYFKDLVTGEILPDQVPNVAYSGEWGNDNATFFYTAQDEAKRPHQIWRHKLGTDAIADELIFEEQDVMFRVGLYKTRDEAYVMLLTRSIETSEMRFLAADDPAGSFTLVHPRQEGMRYFLGHHNGLFYIQTNDANAKNWKLMTTPVDKVGKEHWAELIPHRPGVYLQSNQLFANHLILQERENGLLHLRIRNLTTGDDHRVAFDEPVYTFRFGENFEFNTNLIRFTYMSLTTPDTIYDYDMDSRERELKKRKPVLGGYNPDDYQSERLMATARDGAQVPMSLVYKKGMGPQDGPVKCLLYAYGSYGITVDPTFTSNRLSFLDRGVMFVIAHVRGGQIMGREWYDQGKLLQKKNTFTDFIDCAKHLIKINYTSPDRLASLGGSAGGLLMGAIINMAPELFKATVAAVPFVDVVTTMLDASIPLTVNEYEEWGNPNDEEYYHYMLSYAPYDNVAEQAYPHLLITAGLNDPRVQYWEPAKWIAKLRQTKTDDNTLVMKTNMGAGHGGASGRYDYLKEAAFDYAFILDKLGLTE